MDRELAGKLFELEYFTNQIPFLYQLSQFVYNMQWVEFDAPE